MVSRAAPIIAQSSAASSLPCLCFYIQSYVGLFRWISLLPTKINFIFNIPVSEREYKQYDGEKKCNNIEYELEVFIVLLVIQSIGLTK